MEDINNAIELYDKGLKTEAREAFLAVFEQNKDVDIARHVAKLYKSVNEPLDALFFYEKSLEIEPADWVGLNNVGLIWEELGQDNKAKDYYLRSLKIQGNYEANYNLGVLYRKLHDYSKSVQYLKIAQALKPSDYNANYSLSMSYFIQKDFKRGYPYFLKRHKNIPKLTNKWHGEDFLNDKTIAIYADGGFGDIIMFSRYLPLLKPKFEKIYLVAPINMHELFEIDGVEILKAPKDVDYTCALMDLPYYLKTDFNHIPSCDNLLSVKKQENNNPKKKVGLCWRGNTAKTRLLKNRSIEISLLDKLLKSSDFDFYSFQTDVKFDELRNYPNIKNLGLDFKTFKDTALALSEMDALITVDTAILHLAGTMDIKTFLILPDASEWRWFDDKDKTRWYSSVKIFKQSPNTDFAELLDKIINCLQF